MSLSEKQKKHLRGLGHVLKPVVQIGQNGMTDSVVAEMDQALTAHELVKVRVSGMERDARDEALETLAKRTGSQMAGRIGHTALLYRRNKEKPRITLPV